MSASGFKISRASLQAILKSPGVGNVVKRKADAVLEAAKDAAPVVSGKYQQELHIESYVSDRTVSRVATGVPYGDKVEAKHRVLGKALDAAKGA